MTQLAYIHPEAKIGKNVVIGKFVTISKNVVIEDGTWIGPRVAIMEGARIGKNCKIYTGAVISAVPQDLKFAGEVTTTEIGDNTVIREYVTINRGTKTKGKTVVGSNCVLMSKVHIAHDVILKDHCILHDNVAIAGEVIIDEYAEISGMTAAHQFSRIGKHALISCGSLVRKDVPPYVRAGREPLSFMGINAQSMRRSNIPERNIKDVQQIYRIIFQEKKNNAKSLELIENQFSATKERDEIIEFVKNAQRGIMKGVFGDMIDKG